MKKALQYTFFSLISILAIFFLTFASIFSITPDHSAVTNGLTPIEGACSGTEPRYISEDGYYTFVKKADADFRVLHLTDIHFGGGVGSMKLDDMLISALYKQVNAVKPDLLILTGDVIYSTFYPAMNLNNAHAVRTIGKVIDSMGIPWTVSLGNHDTEDYQYANEEKIIELYSSTEFDNCIFVHPDKETYGRSNQAIRILNNDKSLDYILMLVDSNDYENGKRYIGYDYIHEDQIKWYEDTVRRISEEYNYDGIAPSLCYVHIPMKEYDTAWNLYQSGSDEVVWRFGEKNEKVCAPANAEKDVFFERMVALGSTKEIFCGHDHTNNYSIEYKGIRLTYSLSMDYLAYRNIYKTNQYRGGTLVTIGTNEYTSSQSRFDSIG